jgi:acetate kinase
LTDNPGMQSVPPRFLCINGGSSSIKFAVYQDGPVMQRLLYGQIDRIGQARARLTCRHVANQHRESHDLPSGEHAAVVQALMDWLPNQPELTGLAGIGHRVVHGMRHMEPERVTPELLDELRVIQMHDPDHLPGEIALIEALTARYPDLAQVACFDTAFHRSMPRVATQLAVPRYLADRGLQRYGFHGLSYAYLMEELERIAGHAAARGRVVLAHLGSGASMAAVLGGSGIDTSMGFTPNSGLPMGTRSGDVEPGVLNYLERVEHMTGSAIDDMLNHASGLLGVSGSSPDMRDLLALETTDVRAAEAVALFCYQAKKCLGAYAAALGGLDTVVFAGGVGEHAAPVRARICDGLGFLGLEIDPERNAIHAGVISTDASRVTVRVIRTDEELMIARSVCRVVRLSAPVADRATR